MDNNKTVEKLPHDTDSSYFKTFDNVLIEKKINENEIIEKLKTVFDPEIPVNIYDLGLIYGIKIDNENNINIIMTLTTPNCPVADTMPEKVGQAVSTLKGINSIKVKLVWEPSWVKDMMSEDAKLALDIF